jgi:hypothetical protein
VNLFVVDDDLQAEVSVTTHARSLEVMLPANADHVSRAGAADVDRDKAWVFSQRVALGTKDELADRNGRVEAHAAAWLQSEFT